MSYLHTEETIMLDLEPMETKLDDAFHAGLLAALAVVALHDLETLYREIVATADEQALVDFATRDGALDFSGLSRYGYHLGGE